MLFQISFISLNKKIEKFGFQTHMQLHTKSIKNRILESYPTPPLKYESIHSVYSIPERLTFKATSSSLLYLRWGMRGS